MDTIEPNLTALTGHKPTISHAFANCEKLDRIWQEGIKRAELKKKFPSFPAVSQI